MASGGWATTASVRAREQKKKKKSDPRCSFLQKRGLIFSPALFPPRFHKKKVAKHKSGEEMTPWAESRAWNSLLCNSCQSLLITMLLIVRAQRAWATLFLKRGPVEISHDEESFVKCDIPPWIHPPTLFVIWCECVWMYFFPTESCEKRGHLSSTVSESTRAQVLEHARGRAVASWHALLQMLHPTVTCRCVARGGQPQVLRESRCNILFACHISKSPATREGNNWAAATCLLSSAHSSLRKPLVNPPLRPPTGPLPSLLWPPRRDWHPPHLPPSKSQSRPLMWRMCEGRKQNRKKLKQRGWCAGHGSPAWVASSSRSHTAALANCSDASGCKRTTNGKSDPGHGKRWKGILRKLLISQRGGTRPTWAACAMGHLLRLRVTWPHGCHSFSLRPVLLQSETSETDESEPEVLSLSSNFKPCQCLRCFEMHLE